MMVRTQHMISVAQHNTPVTPMHDLTQSDLVGARYDAKLKAHCAEGARNGPDSKQLGSHLPVNTPRPHYTGQPVNAV